MTPLRAVFPRRAIGLFSFLLGCSATPPPPPPKTTPTPPVVVAPASLETATPVAEAPPVDRIEPLLEALRRIKTPEWREHVGEIRDRFGGPGLVRALDVVDATSLEVMYLQTKFIMDELHALADPRSADPLVAWVDAKKPPMHWQGVVGALLAEIGDLRAVRLLGERMKHKPTDIYDRERWWEQDGRGHHSDNDLQRIGAARLLGDLATMHPDKVDEIRAAVEDSVIAWVRETPAPHHRGMLVLAAIRSEKGLGLLRGWAFPKTPLPARGAEPPFPVAFELAQSGLRAIGMFHDEPSFPKLLAQLERKKDPALDITQDVLNTDNIAMLGMVLRALGVGASQGLSHFADPRAAQPLMKLVEDTTWHEEARFEACDALAWCTDDAARASLFPKIKAQMATGGPKSDFVAGCYASVFTERSAAGNAMDMVDLFERATLDSVRRSMAYGLGLIALESAAQARLEAKLGDKRLRVDAAIALLLGGSGPMTRLLSSIDGFDAREKEQIKMALTNGMAHVTDEDPTFANVLRWATRAEEAADVVVRGERQTWVRDAVAAGLESVSFGWRPHSVTRSVLRYRLFRAAQTDATNRRGLIAMLALMKERGTLLALADTKGDAAAPAAKALAGLGKTAR
ncbi:hypothetical protein [Polyangium jinanense]|uniref:HEAT repeat domain-containing protein n=1 Tax=Polyangium jinanense TaxID=2829994 RepID=A0A9X4AXX0_9BACT|nr:hypothetical protein [Polyangium jinanense]MDC3962013.1 hypothetical protein [Polyangium jinanense]MDC3988909.1 hypothetical protein [Polyangium jinanense]